jgi:hypothetical protein
LGRRGKFVCADQGSRLAGERRPRRASFLITDSQCHVVLHLVAFSDQSRLVSSCIITGTMGDNKERLKNSCLPMGRRCLMAFQSISSPPRRLIHSMQMPNLYQPALSSGDTPILPPRPLYYTLHSPAVLFPRRSMILMLATWQSYSGSV